MSGNPELAVLKTAKLAVDEGLILPEDYNVVKHAFLKAQQIKAGLDAGFLRDEDYEKTREAFFYSLDFTIHVVNTSKQTESRPLPPAPAPVQTTTNGSANQQKPAIPKQPTHRVSGMSVPSPRHPAATPAPPPTFAPVPAAPAASAPSPPAQVAPPPPLQPQGSIQRITGGGTVPVDMSKVPRIVQSVPGMAMSGIGVAVDCVNLFNFIKTRSSNKWVTFRIDDSGHQVVIDQLGAYDSSFQDFMDAFPDSECKYGVFDYTYNRSEGPQIQKLVFFHWAPDGANTRQKMMYASTKEFLKGLLAGIGAEVQISDKSEFTSELVNERIYDTLTRK